MDAMTQVATTYCGYVSARNGEPYNSEMHELYRRGWLCYHLELLKQHGSLLLMQDKIVAHTSAEL